VYIDVCSLASAPDFGVSGLCGVGKTDIVMINSPSLLLMSSVFDCGYVIPK